MKTPWIARDAYEGALASVELTKELCRERVADLKAALHVEQQRVADLIGTIAEMQRAGFAVSPKAPDIDLPTLPDVVVSAIESVAGNLGTDLGRQLVAFAMGQLKQPDPPTAAQVAVAIRRGEDEE